MLSFCPPHEWGEAKDRGRVFPLLTVEPGGMVQLQVAAIDVTPHFVDHIRAIQLAWVDTAIGVLDHVCRIHAIIDGDAVEVAATAVGQIPGALLPESDQWTQVGVGITWVLERVGIARLAQVVDVDLEPVERAVKVLVAITLGGNVSAGRYEIRHLITLLANVAEGPDAIKVKLFDR